MGSYPRLTTNLKPADIKVDAVTINKLSESINKVVGLKLFDPIEQNEFDKMSNDILSAQRQLDEHIFTVFKTYGYDKDWLMLNRDKVTVVKNLNCDNGIITRSFLVNDEELFRVHMGIRFVDDGYGKFVSKIEQNIEYIKGFV